MKSVFFNTWGQLRTGWLVLFGVMALSAAIGGIPFAIITMTGPSACRNAWDPAFRPEWTVTGGCTIVINGQRRPESTYQAQDINANINR